MKNFVSFAVAALLGLGSKVCSAADLILDPPQQAASDKPIAIIWIHGMSC